MHFKTLRLLLAAAVAPCLPAAFLTSISGDTYGVPRQFNVIAPATNSTSSPFSLGDMTSGFTGGLAYVGSTQKYWTIYESMGQSKLASFDTTGAASLADSSVALTPGLWRGLTYSPDKGLFYALYSTGWDPFELYEVDPLTGSISSLFQASGGGFGGMTYLSPGFLTALFTNQTGGYQLHSIDLTAQTVTPFGTTFDINMNGGLAWDTTTNVRYFAIGSDNQGNSSLYGIVGDGSGWGSQFSVGGGYFYSSLTYHGETVPLDPGQDAAVPEPATWLMMIPLMLIPFSLRRGAAVRGR